MAKRRSPPPGRRTPKFSVGDRVHVKIGAPQAYRGQNGTIVEARERARYEVALEEGATVNLYSWWLESAQ
jgi:ribosomal protein L21E